MSKGENHERSTSLSNEANFTLTVTVGGISQKPMVVGGYIEAREVLDVTVSIDHDIVDGAPAARFVDQFRRLIEDGYGLEALAADGQPHAASALPLQR